MRELKSAIDKKRTEREEQIEQATILLQKNSGKLKKIQRKFF